MQQSCKRLNLHTKTLKSVFTLTIKTACIFLIFYADIFARSVTFCRPGMLYTIHLARNLDDCYARNMRGLQET